MQKVEVYKNKVTPKSYIVSPAYTTVVNSTLSEDVLSFHRLAVLV